jgi:beta-glucosidase
MLDTLGSVATTFQTTMPAATRPGFIFATGIENSAPTIGGGRIRRDQMAECGHYERWR